MHDTGIIKSDKQIIEELMAELLKSKEDLGGFLVFQSANTMGAQYKRSLQFLQTFFGEEHKTMTMIILTSVLLMQQSPVHLKKEYLTKVIKLFNGIVFLQLIIKLKNL